MRLSQPYLGDRQKLLSLIEEVIDSGFLVQGKYVAQFEEQIAAYLQVKHAIAVSSGTAALHLALVAIGICPGDEVIAPAFTFPATANVIELVGAKPVLVDVDLDTYNIQVEDIKKVISSKTKAIIPVHLFGNPAEMDYIMEIARDYEITVIEDAAGALGSEYKGRKCGTIGYIGCFSFHPRKIVTTGEGGIVVTDDDELAERIRVLQNHGLKIVKSSYNSVAAGFNYRMNELEAVLGIVQMLKIEETISERRRLAELYMDLLKDMPGIDFQKTLSETKTVWQAFVIRLKNKEGNVILRNLKKAGIEANIGSYALHLLQFYSTKYNYKLSDYFNAAKLYSSTIALPFYNGMNFSSIEQVANTLKETIYDKGETS